MTKSEIRVRKIQGDLSVAFGGPAIRIAGRVHGIGPTPQGGRRPEHRNEGTGQTSAGIGGRFGGIVHEKLSRRARVWCRAHVVLGGAG